MSYFVFIFICMGAGWLGSVATLPEIQGWYTTIQKPSWTPPAAVFGPVWTILYVMMGTAAARVWNKRKGAGAASTALILFAVQLAVNISWSFVFFKFHLPGAAFFVSLVLWASIGLTAFVFSRTDRAAALLMVPYFLWVSFATCLSFAIWQLN